MMVHDTISSGKDDMTELSGWEDLVAPVFNLADWDIKSRRDDSALVNSSKELDNYLSGSMVIDYLELTDISFLLHDCKELDENLGAWSE
jgi:hypothetical protein